MRGSPANALRLRRMRVSSATPSRYGEPTLHPQVLRAESGHLLLVGESGVGKTVLTKFVAWNSGISVKEIQATRTYSLAHFDDDLRSVMKRSGVDKEKLVVLLDADGVKSSFLERMNALLAAGEVPGLWGADDLSRLLTQCRDARRAESEGTDADDAVVMKWFASNVRRNLHVVFCLEELGGASATASPALFNRCVVDWFGGWTREAQAHVGDALIRDVDFDTLGGAPWAETLSTANPERDALLRGAAFAGGGFEEDSSDEDEAAAPPTTLKTALVACLVATHAFARADGATARDFVEACRRFASDISSRREALESRQARKSAGLSELATASADVAERQKLLKEKNAELQVQELEAKSQLEKMVHDQQIAEQKQAQGSRLSEELKVKSGDIEKRKAEAEAELATAEPALIAARTAVQGIKKAQLDELRALRQPPIHAKRTLEAVSVILGLLPLQKTYDWDDVRKALRDRSFIPQVVGFEPKDMDEQAAEMIRQKYLYPSPEMLEKINQRERDQKGDDCKEVKALDFENVNRSSQAAGPLVLWLASQLDYVAIERKVEPLAREVEALEAATVDTREQVLELEAEMAVLAKSVEKYKGAYAIAVRSAEGLKADIETGRVRADRASRLVASLRDEQQRWASEAANFPSDIMKLPGQCVRDAIEVAYAGKRSETQRRRLREEVSRVCATLDLALDTKDLTASVAPSTLRRWHDRYGLPRDARCALNAAIFDASSRSCIFVDPTGAALRFASALLAEKRVTVISAGDINFARQLCTAARFGTSLIVKDVDDAWDSIAHPLLNKEFARKAGGQSVIIGGEDVDVSDGFELVLCCRESENLPRGLLGRVNIVDFSTTPDALTDAILSKVVRRERPELEHKRQEAARSLEKQQARLAQLEDEVLELISTHGEGGLLDDERAVEALQKAKAESSEALEASRSSETTLTELKRASVVYEPSAKFAARLFGTLASLEQFHSSYAYALDDYLAHALHDALRRAPAAPLGVENGPERFQRLTTPLLREAGAYVAGALLQREHRASAALAVAKLLCDARKEAFGTVGEDVEAFLASEGTFEEARRLVTDVLGENWLETSKSGAACIAQASLASDARLEVCNAALDRRKIQRRKRRSSVTSRKSLVEEDEPEEDAALAAADAAAVEADLSALKAPIMTVVAERNGGRDGASDAQTAASERGASIDVVALGSVEGEALALDALRRGAASGSWVLLENAHLASKRFVAGLEKRIRACGGDALPGFRVVLTVEATPGIEALPLRLFAASRVIALPSDAGLRASLLRHDALAAENPAPLRERGRVRALFALAHAVVTERARYDDGWSKAYEWGDVDAVCALRSCDAVLDACTQAHVAPAALPWASLRDAFESTYGARLERESDRRALKALADLLVSREAFEMADTAPLPCGAVLGALPDGFELTRDTWRAWIAALPAATPCTALGLGSDADERREARAAETMLACGALLTGAARAVATTEVGDANVEALIDELAQCRSSGAGAVAEATKREVASGLAALKRDGGAAAAQGRAAAALASNRAVALNALARPAQLVAALKIDAAASLGGSLDDLELAVVGDGLELAGVACRGLEPVAPLTVAWRPRTTEGVLVPLILARAPLALPLAEVRVIAEGDAALRNATFVAE